MLDDSETVSGYQLRVRNNGNLLRSKTWAVLFTVFSLCLG